MQAVPVRPTIFTPKVLAALGAVWFIWGSTYLAIKAAVATLPPLLMSGARYVTAGAILLAYVFATGEWRRNRPEPRQILTAAAIGMLVLGGSTFLQVFRLGPMGSGYMCPATFTAAYLGPSLLAVKTGGLPLLFGMTIFAGALEAALSKLLHRMRSIFPPELSGLVIFMIGWGAGIAGLRLMLGGQSAPVSETEWWVAGVTMATMAALNVWGRGILRMLCACSAHCSALRSGTPLPR